MVNYSSQNLINLYYTLSFRYTSTVVIWRVCTSKCPRTFCQWSMAVQMAPLRKLRVSCGWSRIIIIIIVGYYTEIVLLLVVF